MGKGMKDKKQVTIDAPEVTMEAGEGKRPAVQMPNLPKSLTLEEKKFLLAVERGDLPTTRKMLQKAHRHPDYMDMNCVDPLGRGALHMAISNENLECVEMLVVMGVETRDSLLHAIDSEFVEAVEVLLEHEEVIHKPDHPYSWELTDRNTSAFTPEITPLILAAHKDNYEILKILLDRGAMLPMPHDIRCGCPECIKTSSEDSLRHSRSRINAYRALASPSLIALSSTDPIITAFELSWELKNLANTEHEFRSEYLELRKKCMAFAEELLSHTRSSMELAVILNHDPDSINPYEDGEHMMLRRLELAIDYKQKKFVAHPNVQQLLAALWYEGLPGFRRKAVMDKLFEIVKVVALFPVYCMVYMLAPHSETGKLIRTPFMKFLTHSASYLFFLLMLILVSVRFENLVIWLFGTENMKRNLQQAMRKQRGNLPTPTECLVVLWVFGFIWEEIKEIWRHGISKYLRNMWNILDIMRDSLYGMTLILRVLAYIQQWSEIASDPATAFIPREEWNSFDPQLISEGLFAAANILSALKLVHIFSINPYLGPLQISLGRMVIDIVKFFFIYSLVLFAFACGLTQLLWYYNDLEKQKCYSLPGGQPDWKSNGDACMKWRRWHNLFEASQSLFWAGFGMVGLDDFELTGSREYTRFWSMLMFGAYSVINIIVLLNLLIAMMSSSYSFIVEHADTEWKFARTKLWMSYFEMGNTLPPPFNIFPTPKSFLRVFGKKTSKEDLVRRLSAKSETKMRKARDIRYLAVMRALLWRYVCSLQRKNEERPINEDDISEVKGDISSLRFELIDLFEANGMDVSQCAKKSRAALGRKMRVWERRLMRDFHVSPAMGSGDPLKEPPPEEDGEKGTGLSKFKKAAKLAIATKAPGLGDVVDGMRGASQIGCGTSECRDHLKEAMEKARRKMEAGTPDGSPGSSRGCSPFPDLYTGPHLLDAIKSLELSPINTPSPTPMPSSDHMIAKKDGQAKDLNMLTIPGRRIPSSLKKTEESSNVSLDVPTNMFSKDNLKKLQDIKAAGGDNKPKSDAPKPATPTTKSADAPKPAAPGTKSADAPKPAAPTTKSADAPKPAAPKPTGNVTKPPVVVTTVSEKAPVVTKKDESKVQKESAPTVTPGAPKPSQIKSAQPQPKPSQGPPAPIKIPPPVSSGHRREGEAGKRGGVSAPIQQTEQMFTGSEELESVDFVRRPGRMPVPKQDSKDERKSVTPSIAITPSTPAPTETPVPPTPPTKKIAAKPNIDMTPPPIKMPAEKADAPKPPAAKPAEVKAPAKPAEVTAPSPPAATFKGNAPTNQSEPLISQVKDSGKKGGWI